MVLVGFYSLRVFLWALVLGPFDSGGVGSMGSSAIYGIYLVHEGSGDLVSRL